jgi:hypothetical protein
VRAQREAEALLAWREELLEALKRRRNRCWLNCHGAVRWIIKFGLGSERGVLMAATAEAMEQDALETDSVIERLSNLTPQDWDAVVEFYRSTIRRTA